MICLLAVAPASAQVTNTWTNDAGGRWSVAINWQGVPNPGLYQTNVLRFLGSNDYSSLNDFAPVPYRLHGLVFGQASNALVTLAGNQLRFLANGATLPAITQTGAGHVLLSNAIGLVTNLILNGSGSGILTNAGTISGVGFGLHKQGSHTHVLVNRFNSYSGDTVISEGRLEAQALFNNATPLGTGPVVLRGGALGLRADTDITFGPGTGYNVTVVSNATLTVNPLTLGVNNAFRLGTLSLGNAQLTVEGDGGARLHFKGTTKLTGSSTRLNIASAPLSLDGIITDGGKGYALRKLGEARLFITNLTASSYKGGTILTAGALQILATNGMAGNTPLGTGPITLQGGTLELRHLAGLQKFGTGSGYAVAVTGDATIDVDRFSGSAQNGLACLGRLTNFGVTLTISGGNNFNLIVNEAAVISGTATFHVTAGRGANPFSFSLAGPITEAATNATFHKSGPGVASLAGANTYSGPTLVSGGTLLANNLNGSATGTGQVTVRSGARLGGIGRVAGPVLVEGGGTLAPGNVDLPGLLRTGNYSALAGATNFFQLNGTLPGSGYDRLNITGTVSLGGDLRLSLGYFPTLGDEFLILENDLTDAISGTFSGLVEGAPIDIAGTGVRLRVSYLGGTGNDVVLTTIDVPEPATWSLVALGVALTLRRAWRSRFRSGCVLRPRPPGRRNWPSLLMAMVLAPVTSQTIAAETPETSRVQPNNGNPPPSLTITDATVSEGNAGTTQAVFNVFLSAASAEFVSVNYTLTGGTATEGLDYLAASGTLTFEPGMTNLTLAVTVVGDIQIEPNETFLVKLNSAANATLGDDEALGTILNDDGAAGDLQRFAWSAVGPTQVVNSPFPVTLTALDASGAPATNFTGPALLSALGGVGNVVAGFGLGQGDLPFATFFHDARVQSIYLASELGGPRRITALAVFVTSLPGQRLDRFTIRLKHTSLSDYGGAAAWEAADWTVAYQANQEITNTGWATFNLQTPFQFNGTNQLLVDFSYDNDSFSADGFCRVTPTPAPRSLVHRTDSGFGDPLNWTGTTSPAPSAENWIVNLRFTYGDPLPVTPAVTANFTNGIWTGNASLLQQGFNVTLLAQDGAGHSGLAPAFDVGPPGGQPSDTDGDGIPDNYEVANGLDPANPADGAQDKDGDGASNLAEYLAGTDPQDAASVLRITELLRIGLDTRISFPTVNGKSYALERTDNLTTRLWATVTNNIPGTGTPAQPFDLNGANEFLRVYRIRLQLP